MDRWHDLGVSLEVFGFLYYLLTLSIHRKTRQAPRSVTIRAPRWLVALCLNPRGNDTIDIECTGYQLAALLWVLGLPLAWCLGFTYEAAYLGLRQVFVVVVIASYTVGQVAKNRQHNLQQ